MAESGHSPGDSEESAAEAVENVDLMELTLKERIALATAQQPTMALVLILFGLFAFTFLIALALVYPTIAGLFIGMTLVVSLFGLGMFLLLRRVRGD